MITPSISSVHTPVNMTNLVLLTIFFANKHGPREQGQAECDYEENIQGARCTEPLWCERDKNLRKSGCIHAVTARSYIQ
jgi:hypothetical protein